MDLKLSSWERTTDAPILSMTAGDATSQPTRKPVIAWPLEKPLIVTVRSYMPGSVANATCASSKVICS